ncbi:MAG: S1 RNA-binding domain-containing protein [Clostridiales bacterium]|nr:S1 RNA-binding domain-containing protein [Clostridiales bacterium]
MQAEIGSIVDGKVNGIQPFGAFITLPTGETGMVHISEVSDDYVHDIRDYLTEGQEVRVKVLGVNDKNKISLSVKQAMTVQEKEAVREEQRSGAARQRNLKARVWQGPPKRTPREEMTFEEMMSSFKKTSEEKLSDLKRTTEAHTGGSSRRK